MRNRRWLGLWIVVLGVTCAAAQRAETPGEQFVGTWTGTWDGAGSGGGFELTLEKDKNNAITGRVSVTGEPTYKATLKAIAFDGNKMTAKYEFTPDPRAEVRLATTFDRDKATGTWSLRDAASGDEVASGSWTVSRK